ncbi:MAG: hypothetical protein JXQ75_09230 [Phycisphaerae bacterium]|nr:hypothetical protein [Phycisphaerae bacterium]
MDHATWLGTFQELLRYYLGPVENSPLVNVGSLVAILAGAFLTFRCWKFERSVVSICGLVIGAWLGYWASLFVGVSAPIPAAVGAVVMTVLAYRTYHWWLAIGSVVVLFGAGVVFQLGRGDLHRYLPDLNQANPPIRGDLLGGLVSKAQQESNLHPSLSDQLEKLKGPVVRELKALGPVGWLLPVAGALLGGLLAYWALRGFAVVWVGFVGATMVVFGAAAFLCAHWPKTQAWMISEPQYAAGSIIGLWLLGLLLQAKEARLPKKPDGASAKDSPKS